MKQRCLNPRAGKYPTYGGRGITLCPEWLTFEGFYNDMGSKPSPTHSIDRIDNDGPYEKSNCRWASLTEQANNKSNSRRLSDADRQSIYELREKGVSRPEIAVLFSIPIYYVTRAWSKQHHLNRLQAS